MRAILFFILGLLLVGWPGRDMFAQPQRLNFKHLSQYDGLLQQNNNYIFQDSKGFVWISSVSGLNRFNGIAVKTYTPNAADSCSLRGHNITSPFFEDSNSDIWFTTYEGIHRWSRKDDCFSYHPLKDASGKPMASDNLLFARDESGLFWILSGFSQVYTYHPKTKRQRKVFQAVTDKCFPGFEGEVLRYVLFYVRATGQVGVNSVRNGTVVQQQLYSQAELGLPAELAITAMYYAGKGQIWAASNLGLVRIDLRNPARNRIFQLPPFQGAAPAVSSLCRFSASQLLIGSSFAGIYIFDEAQERFIRHYKADDQGSGGLTNNDIWNVYTDPQSNIWVALRQGEINYASVRKNKFENILTKDHLPGISDNVNINNLLEDQNGVLWVGTQDDGIFAIDGKGQIRHYLVTENDGDMEQVFRLFEDRNGKVWSIRGRGLMSYFDGSRWVDLNAGAAPPLVIVLGGLVTADGDILAGSVPGGLYVVKNDPGGLKSTRIDTHAIASVYTYLHEASNKRLYACRNWEDVEVFAKRNGRWAHEARLGIKGIVNSIYENRARDSLYLATSFGLVALSLKTNRFRTITLADGLPDLNVQAVLEDGAGRLWFSTKRGIVQYSPQTGAMRTFALSDGLQGLEFFPAAARLRDGRFLFGGVHGVNSLYPDRISPVDTYPPIELAAIHINDTIWRHPVCAITGARNISEVKKIHLRYFQNTIALSFVGMDYGDAQRVSYRYFMKNYDAPGDTTNAGNTGFARYTKLPPGSYVFHVFAANPDGSAESSRQLQIEIMPPFWQTWWFHLLEIVAALALLWGGIRLYVNAQLRKVRIQQEKQAALQRERDRIASEMHDDLGAGLSTIRLMSERVRMGIEDPAKGEQINRIARHASDLIEKMATIIWAMNSSHDTLPGLFHYLRRYAAEYAETNELRCHFPIPADLPEWMITGDRRRQIFLTFKEALHNIVKHARAESVEIRFCVLPGQIAIDIADDGIGLQEGNKSGNGLLNMRKRMQVIKGSCNWEPNTPNGTVVKLEIPLTS